MTAIVDYGVGNLFSLASSLRFLGQECTVTGDRDEIERADRVILPGVGAFGDAMARLRAAGLDGVVKEQAEKKPLLGICLGMQLLFDRSFEYGEHEGLGVIPGEVRPLAADISPEMKVPHMGWNRLDILRDDPIFRYFPRGASVYYVHSYYAAGCAESTLAASEYGIQVPGMVRRGNIYGAQFHPEKSGEAGLGLLRAFSEMRGEAAK